MKVALICANKSNTAAKRREVFQAWQARGHLPAGLTPTAGAIVETSALGHHQEEALQVTGTFPDNIWETEL